MGRNESENSYRNILKGTSIFGGVQFFQILINLVRGKFVAMFLGPEGMGISALFNTASQTIQKFASLGLNLAIVKEVASNRNDPASLAATFSVGRRIIYASALVGALVCILFSDILSRVSFGNGDHADEFMLLGAAVFFSIAGSGMLSLLQGLHEVRRLSRSSLVGGLAGLLVGVPLYYFFGNAAIVPAMIILSLTIFIFYWISLQKAIRQHSQLAEIRFSWQTHRPIVIRLISLGLLLMASDLIGAAMSYALNMFLRSAGDLDTVGLYQAANSLTNQYSGVVFSAMALDYFPRLTASVSDNTAMKQIVNRQIEIVALIISPVISILILTAPLVVSILLTSDFMPVVGLIRWMGLGVLIKALMFPMGYIAFAKGNKRVFFWLEGVLGNILTFGLGALGFLLFGLTGMGYAMVADCLLCFLIYLAVNRKLYSYTLNRRTWLAVFSAIAAGTAVFATSFIPERIISVTTMSVITCLSAFWSFKRLKVLLKH